jgi:hypothetical protein
MKILKKKVKLCDDSDGGKTNVLDLEYSHKGKTWKILIRDYDDSNYKDILKRLRVEVRNLYNNQEVLKQHNENRV